jgi:hypothetical protein
VGQALDALRAIERAGASQVLEQVFTGLRALPAHITVARPWREVLGVAASATPTPEIVESRFRELARSRHPDNGGSHDQFVELESARRDALRELGAA